MKKYPKTQKYDSKWIEQNWMGPNPLWLLEDLCEHMDLKPGMKVLDMGCGKGLTSVFLAKEYGVTVFANDLWISATDNLRRFEEAGVADKVFPIHAEAHALPYGENFFDAAISIDSYHYYGTDDWYFPCVYSKLVKPGGQFGIICPGFTKEFAEGYPPNLETAMDDDLRREIFTFHSKDWWYKHWNKTGIVDITACYEIDEAKTIWTLWAKWSKEHLNFNDDEFLDADVDNELALIALAAKKKV